MVINRLIGAIFIWAAFFIIILNQQITGAVIGFSSLNISYLFALAFLVAGIFFFIHGGLGKNLADEVLKSGAVITDPRKIEKIARKMGYDEREVKEGHQILNNGHPITVIPRHHISDGVYRSIFKALSSGESNFRQQYRHA